MRLNELIDGDVPDIEITGIETDGRLVKDGFAFFCTGKTEFIPQALNNGAVAVISEDSTVGIKVENIHEAASIAAARFYKDKPKNVVAVTGTNGKTSTVTFFKQIIELLGNRAATIGTLGVHIGNEFIEGQNTTPGAVEFHRTLADIHSKGIDFVAFEASSHGLDQYRTHNVSIKAAGFTNLTRDHIDYHKDMEHYFKAKEKLFTEILPQGGIAVLNADIDEFAKLKDCGRTILDYGKNARDLKIISVEPCSEGQSAVLEVGGNRYEIALKVAGYFQVMNILCAVGLVYACGFEMKDILETLPNLRAPVGRLEFVASKNGAEIYIDYAHTPDALENALKSLKEHTRGKLAVVFGCGGDRDSGKRPMMGKSASELADIVYVTDDNPRSEDPASIRAQVLAGSIGGIDAGDRENALKLAIKNLSKGDVLLVAGKGHETYQIINGVYFDFSDKLKILELI